jgi:hypothetical protein
MNYQERKMIALGLAAEPAETVSDSDLLSVGPGGMRPRVCSIFYGKPLVIHPAQERFKIALALMDEYRRDRRVAKERLDFLCRLLGHKYVGGVHQLFSRHRAAEWLSYAFLDEEDIRKLMDAVYKTSPGCVQELKRSLKLELKRFVTFKELFGLLINDKEE